MFNFFKKMKKSRAFSSKIEEEVRAYLEDNPDLKAYLYEEGATIDKRIDAGVAYAKKVVKSDPDRMEVIGAIGAVAAALYKRRRYH